MGVVADHEQLIDDLTVRVGRAARRLAPDVRVVAITPLTGGSSSLTFVAELADVPQRYSRVVLKVAPPGLPPVRNRDVLRQGRLMDAVAGAPGVRVPHALFADAGDPLGAPPFLAMDLVPGECVEPVLRPRGTLAPADVRSRALDAARMLAALHRIDPAQAGLAGETVMSLGAEIDRWTRAFSTVPTELNDGYAEVAEALHATAPPALGPVVTHGDFRLGNTLCEGGRVTAIIDWEIWALGDPRIDLTWFSYFTDEARHPAAVSDEPTGMPTRAEILAAYRDAAGADPGELRWFDALTRYKESAATALLIKRGLRSGQPTAMHRQMQPALPRLRREALELLRG